MQLSPRRSPRLPLLAPLGAALALAAALAGGCSRAPRSPELPPGTPVVLISVDTLRSDHLPAYGYRGVATPAIDALAHEGIVFEHAFAAVPLTLPSHTTMLSGLLPRDHGVRNNLGYALDAAEVPWLPRLLHDAGYATGGAVSALVLAGNTGLRNGFDFYEDSFTWTADTLLGAVQRPGGDTLGRLVGWLRGLPPETRDGRRPFFAFLHLYEPHTPYAPPAPFAARYAAAPYDGEIAAADALVGELVAELRRLGVWDRALVVLVSDHGEGLGEHGEEEHGILLYREALQVPLIVKLPQGAMAGRRVATPVGLVDLYPTIAAVVRGAKPDPRQPGRSLLATAGEEAAGLAPAPRTLLAETFFPRLQFGWSELVSVVRGDEHLVDGPTPELFDLARDPGERHDVLRERRRAYAELHRAADAYGHELAPPLAATAELRARLASLGYVGPGGTADEAGPRPDPRTQIASLEENVRGFREFSDGHYEEAARLLRAAVDRHPAYAEAWLYLARSLAALGRGGEALQAYGRNLELAGASAGVVGEMAAILVDSGEPARALALVDDQLARTPDAARLLSLRVRSLLMLDRAAEALPTADRLVAAVPDRAQPRYERAIVLAMLGRTAEAEAGLRDALRIDPQHAAARNDLAVLERRAGTAR